jgi:hypothetical protein
MAGQNGLQWVKIGQAAYVLWAALCNRGKTPMIAFDPPVRTSHNGPKSRLRNGPP